MPKPLYFFLISEIFTLFFFGMYNYYFLKLQESSATSKRTKSVIPIPLTIEEENDRWDAAVKVNTFFSSFLKFSQVFSSFTKFYQVLPSFTKFYQVLPSLMF
jgi:hypothetical protein